MQEKLLVFCGKPFVEPFFNFFEISEGLLCEAMNSLMRRGDTQKAPRLGRTAGAEGCPIQAISRCLSLVLLCEMARSHVTKSLCHVFWSSFDQCVI
ncbi:hypothetical protein TNCV_3956751 [Trichonephila clavipes]|nr:hypothetical protein TNCV_3956751 [Trichonephila clavipes]